MYLTISFKGIPKFNTNIYMYAYTMQVYDSFNNKYYIFITDTKPINNYDICSKIPTEFFGELENYTLIISSKEGTKMSREDTIVFNTNFSYYIEEYKDDIIIYINNDKIKEYLSKISRKSMNYYYSLKFNDMELTKEGNMSEFYLELNKQKKSANKQYSPLSVENFGNVDNLDYAGNVTYPNTSYYY